MKKNIILPKLLVSVMVLMPTLSNAIVGFDIPATTRAITNSYSQSNTEITKLLQASATKQVANYAKNAGLVNESIRKAVNQEAMSSLELADADKKSRQVFANALLANSIAKEQLDVIMKFSPTTGQGFASCKVLSENQQLGQVLDTIGEQAENKVNELDNAPGQLVPNSEAAFSRRKEIHDANFCTETEQDRNQCKVTNNGETQGADSNSNTLFISAKKGSAIGFAKDAVRQNLLLSPTIAIPKEAGKTAEGQAYLLASNHKTALSAFPAYSLAYIQSMSEIRDDVKDSTGKPTSPNDLLFNTVSRYFGGKDSMEWQKSMISQQPRGLLVELAKMEGLGAWMDYQEMLANQRIEGNLAAMTLTAALPMEKRLSDQDQLLNTNAIKDKLQQ